jgi:hypothetical protein
VAFDAAVLHASVLCRGWPGFVVVDPRGDDLAYEQGVRSEIDGVANLAVHPGERLVEHRRATRRVAHRPAVQRRAVVDRRLGELHEQLRVVGPPQVHSERSAVGDQATRDG